MKLHVQSVPHKMNHDRNQLGSSDISSQLAAAAQHVRPSRRKLAAAQKALDLNCTISVDWSETEDPRWSLLVIVVHPLNGFTHLVKQEYLNDLFFRGWTLSCVRAVSARLRGPRKGSEF